MRTEAPESSTTSDATHLALLSDGGAMDQRALRAPFAFWAEGCTHRRNPQAPGGVPAIRGMNVPTARNVEWVRLSAGQRLGYAGLAAVLLLVAVAITWLVFSTGARPGVIDVALMGGSLAGGAVALWTAATGKKQRLRR